MKDLRKFNLTSNPSKFQNFIFSWWADNKRDLPWRRTRDPYKILVSEVMLQQTQVSRVLPKYAEFIEAFPDIYALAHATVARILKVWKGMGYNRRALYLKKTAEIIVHQYQGYFPQTEQELTKLPGVGTYTARALLVFAFEKNVAMVDTNIRQIITHFFFNDTLQKESIIQQVADKLLPRGKSWEWHQALMDYGALELTKIPGIVKKQKKFKDSNRFYRGKIIDILRESNIEENVLRKDFSVSIIEGLIADGLIEREKGMLRLPR